MDALTSRPARGPSPRSRRVQARSTGATTSGDGLDPAQTTPGRASWPMAPWPASSRPTAKPTAAVPTRALPLTAGPDRDLPPVVSAQRPYRSQRRRCPVRRLPAEHHRGRRLRRRRSTRSVPEGGRPSAASKLCGGRGASATRSCWLSRRISAGTTACARPSSPPPDHHGAMALRFPRGP